MKFYLFFLILLIAGIARAFPEVRMMAYRQPNSQPNRHGVGRFEIKEVSLSFKFIFDINLEHSLQKK